MSTAINREQEYINRKQEYINREQEYINREQEYINRKQEYINREQDALTTGGIIIKSKVTKERECERLAHYNRERID